MAGPQTGNDNDKPQDTEAPKQLGQKTAEGVRLMMVGWLVLIIIAIYYFRNQGGIKVYRRDALELLNERYARGEISTEEFNERRQVLKNS